MSLEDQPKPAPGHIAIPGDMLVPDPEFCEVVLDGATRRTARRLERQGLPYVMVRDGSIARSTRAGHGWLRAFSAASSRCHADAASGRECGPAKRNRAPGALRREEPDVLICLGGGSTRKL